MRKITIQSKIIFSCILVSIILIFITWEAVVETENWNPFDIDYTNKDKVIAGYGALLSAILSAFSIILLVYTIFLQIKESKKQSKRFKKEYKLQNELFDSEKKREESKYKLDLFYKLKLINVFLESIIKHIEETAVEIKTFIVAEKEDPIGMNTLYFLVNKNMAKLIEMDYLAIFIAFKEFLNTEENWTNNFNNLFSLVGFYKDAMDEVRENFKYHSKDKFQRKTKISDDLKKIMDNAVEVLELYKKKYKRENYLKQPYSKLINNFISEYYKILEADLINKDETDFDGLSQGLLYNFLKEAILIRAEIGFDELGVKGLVSDISTVRKNIAKLKFDCLYFANDLNTRYDHYFSKESIQLKKIKELKEYMGVELNKIDIDKI